MRRVIFILIATVLTNISYSQSIFNTEKPLTNNIENGYNISGEIIGLKDSTVMLAYYFGGKQYATDTAIVKNGKFTFKGEKDLKGGIYLVVMSDSKYFDLIVSEQKFSFITKSDDLVAEMSFTNSKENPPFYEYLNFITQMQEEVTPLRQSFESASDDIKLNIQKQINEIDLKVKNYRDNFLNINSDKFFSKILNANTQIIIPDEISDSSKSYQLNYYRNHFWDYIDFSDERLLRTRVFYNKMDQFLEKLTAKHPDSISVSADILVEKSKANKEIFQYVVSYITSTYERSKIMGMDAVFVHMVENYYITNKCDWVDSTQLVKITDRAQKIAPNLIGRKASEFLDYYGRPFMKDTLGVLHTLEEIKSDYTVLVFFGPTCGHCKKEIPKIKNDVDSLIAIGYNIKTFAVATEFDKEEWKKFINDQETGEWINVADINHDDDGNPVASSDWRDKYDIYSTPVIYLLDKSKKIIAKRITHKQMVEIICLLKVN